MFFFLQSCVLMQLLTGDCQDRTSWSYIFGCQLNLTYMGLPGSSLFPEGIGSIKWSGEFSNQLFDRWPKEMSDFYWFNFGILTIYGYMNIRVYIYIFFIYHTYTQLGYTNYLHILSIWSAWPENLSINHYQQYGWGLSALDKRRPCIRKWPRLWLGKDRKVMRCVTSVENRYLQMMQSIHATSGNDNQYNDYISVIIFIYFI